MHLLWWQDRPHFLVGVGGLSQIPEAACISRHVVPSIFKEAVWCRVLPVLATSLASPAAAAARQRGLSAFQWLLIRLGSFGQSRIISLF